MAKGRGDLTGNEPGLRGYWSLDEGNGTIAHDLAPQSGHSNGTLINGPVWATNEPCVPAKARGVAGGGCHGRSPDDLLTLLGAWGPCSSSGRRCDCDLNRDGSVDARDLQILLMMR